MVLLDVSFFTNQEILFGAITFIQVPYQYRPLCYFLSYKRIWEKTDAEIEEEKGIPETPREVTLYNITRAINGLIFSTGSAAEAKFSFRKETNMIYYKYVSWSEQLVWQQFK